MSYQAHVMPIIRRDANRQRISGESMPEQGGHLQRLRCQRRMSTALVINDVQSQSRGRAWQAAGPAGRSGEPRRHVHRSSAPPTLCQPATPETEHSSHIGSNCIKQPSRSFAFKSCRPGRGKNPRSERASHGREAKMQGGRCRPRRMSQIRHQRAEERGKKVICRRTGTVM